MEEPTLMPGDEDAESSHRTTSVRVVSYYDGLAGSIGQLNERQKRGARNLRDGDS